MLSGTTKHHNSIFHDGEEWEIVADVKISYSGELGPFFQVEDFTAKNCDGAGPTNNQMIELARLLYRSVYADKEHVLENVDFAEE